MSSAIPAENVRLLRQFVGLCEAQPDLLHAPELEFFRQWLRKYLLPCHLEIFAYDWKLVVSFRLGATLPEPKKQASPESHRQGTKMDIDDEEPAPAPRRHEEPPKVESDPESELGKLHFLFS